MELTAVAIAPIIIALIYGFTIFMKARAERNMDENNFVIRPAKFIYMWIGLIGLILPVTAIAVGNYHWGQILFIAAGIYLIREQMLYRVYIRGNEISYKRLFKDKKTFTFDDIKEVYIVGNDPKTVGLYSETQKLLSVASTEVGYTTLIKRSKKEGKIKEE